MSMQTKNRFLLSVVYPLVFVLLTLSNMLVFADRISDKINHVGFWFILTFGLSVGVALVSVITWFAKKKES